MADQSLEGSLRRQLQASVADLTPSPRLRTTVLEGRRPSARRRRTGAFLAATIGVAGIGIGTAAAGGLFDRPDPRDAAAVEHMTAFEEGGHGPGWRWELMAEGYLCSWAGEELHTLASTGPLAAALDADILTSTCRRQATEFVDQTDGTAPAFTLPPRVCATSKGVFDPTLTDVGPFPAVVLGGRTCGEAGYSDTDVPRLLAIINDRRAREARFLARFDTGTCLTAEESLAIGRRHLSDLGSDFDIRLEPRGPEEVCFRPRVSWERHEAVLHPTRSPS